MKIIILSFIVMIIIGCSGSKSSFPSNINIKKNQLRYIDDTMQIWANDGEGEHHNFSPKDSSEYKFVTNHIGSCLLYTSPSPRDQRGSRMPSSA